MCASSLQQSHNHSRSRVVNTSYLPLACVYVYLQHLPSLVKGARGRDSSALVCEDSGVLVCSYLLVHLSTFADFMFKSLDIVRTLESVHFVLALEFAVAVIL